jgi:ketosteroid isomerase-like protein
MFLQCLSQAANVDECFELLSDDFTYWSIVTRHPVDKATLRDEVDRHTPGATLKLDFLRCFNDGESVVIEAEADGATSAGVRYNSPAVFIFETRDGLITSLREYSDTQLTPHVFGLAGT